MPSPLRPSDIWARTRISDQLEEWLDEHCVIEPLEDVTIADLEHFAATLSLHGENLLEELQQQRVWLVKKLRLIDHFLDE